MRQTGAFLLPISFSQRVVCKQVPVNGENLQKHTQKREILDKHNAYKNQDFKSKQTNPTLRVSALTQTGQLYISFVNFQCPASNSLRRRANARNVSTSLLPYGGITYLINSFDYPNLLCFNSPATQHQFL